MQTFDQVLIDKINNWKIGEWPVGNMVLCIVALLLSVLLCGIIGIEREKRGRSAGLRTHLLVGVGSCLVMIISIYGFPALFNDHRDVARLAAQVVTGVGFLGAGAIIHKNSGTRGLTTAATIWIAMAIGVACGSMNFILAIAGTLIIVVVLTLFRKFETRLNKKAPIIIIRAKDDTPVVSKVLELAKTFDCTVSDLQVELEGTNEIEITFQAISKTSEFQTNEFISKLENMEGITQVGLLNNHKA